MREKQRILIATTNQGKFEEVLHIVKDLPFDFVSLRDVGYAGDGPEETEPTLLGNAMLKARHYGNMFGVIAMADDSGLFIDALSGWPGIASARIAGNSRERNAMVLEKMQNIAGEVRGATFRDAIVVYDPRTDNLFTTSGEIRGTILTEQVQPDGGFGYDPIFFIPEAKKTFAEMTMLEKNAMSHRGKALFQMKYILQNEYGGKHIVVPVAIILQGGLVLMAKRNDPFRPAFHGKWEFPGGRMDIGETLEDNLKREVWEEVGYVIEPIQRLSEIWVEHQKGEGWTYQVYLIPYACRILQGGGAGSDAEVMETRWFPPDAVLHEELIGANKAMYMAILPELKQCI